MACPVYLMLMMCSLWPYMSIAVAATMCPHTAWRWCGTNATLRPLSCSRRGIIITSTLCPMNAATAPSATAALRRPAALASLGALNAPGVQVCNSKQLPNAMHWDICCYTKLQDIVKIIHVASCVLKLQCDAASYNVGQSILACLASAILISVCYFLSSSMV